MGKRKNVTEKRKKSFYMVKHEADRRQHEIVYASNYLLFHVLRNNKTGMKMP